MAAHAGRTSVSELSVISLTMVSDSLSKTYASSTLENVT